MAGETTEQVVGWAVVEMLGYRRVGGFVQETKIAGHGMLRIDVPGAQPGSVVATQFISPSSVYAITPVSEEVARAAALRSQPEPVARWELPASTQERERAKSSGDTWVDYEEA